MEGLKTKSKESLYFFTKAILNFNKLTPGLHQEVSAFIQDFSIPRKLLLLPRGHYKSTISTIGYALWLMIQDIIPGPNIPGSEIRILLSNESATNAEHFLSTIENVFETNQLFRLLFNHLLPDSGIGAGKSKRWNQSEMLIKRESSWPEATIETIGVGGAAQSRHYDVIIFDDLIGKEAMDSETTMTSTISWFDYAESLFVSPTKGIANVIGTRWTKRDLYQHILEDDKRYKVYKRECIEDNKPIFPEEFTLEFYDDLRKKNFAHYSSQYCNNPTDPSKCDFKEEWLKYYTYEHTDDSTYIRTEDEEKGLPFRELDIVGAFDPSIDEKPTASQRAIVIMGQDHKSRVFLLDTYASRDTVDKVLDAIFSINAKWHPRDFLVESVALSRLYLPLIEKEGKLRHKYVSCTPITVSTQRGKDARIRDAIQQVAAEGRLYVQTHHRDFIQQFLDFPQGKFKDVVDAAAMCLTALRTPDSEEDGQEQDRIDEEMIAQRSPITGY